MKRALRIYAAASGAFAAAIIVYGLRGGDPSTCAHPSIRCGGDDPQVVVW